MLAQAVIVALLVLGCAVYATWTLLPASARRVVAQTLLKRPLPERFAMRLRKHAEAPSGCGCDGCDHSSKKNEASVVRTINFHPRVPR